MTPLGVNHSTLNTRSSFCYIVQTRPDVKRSVHIEKQTLKVFWQPY